MKRTTILLYNLFLFSLVLSVCSLSYAQVGINTKTPNGILDISNTTQGFVYPNVALTITTDEAPVINPNGASLVVGTVVYNTNTTSTGSVTDVHPGVYVWDGSEWTIHFKKRQAEIFEQTSSLRTESNFAGDWQDIPGIGVSDSKTFSAKYSGLYKIEIKTNFGGGDMIDNGDTNVAPEEGEFRFTFDGTSYTFSTKSYSTYNANVNGGTYYSDIWKESYITLYLNLTATATYSFYLEFDQFNADGFVSSGNSGNGRGYIGTDIPCFIEITYIDE